MAVAKSPSATFAKQGMTETAVKTAVAAESGGSCGKGCKFGTEYAEWRIRHSCERERQ